MLVVGAAAEGDFPCLFRTAVFADLLVVEWGGLRMKDQGLPEASSPFPLCLRANPL